MDFLNQIDETAAVSNSTPEMDHIRYFVNNPPGSPQLSNGSRQQSPGVAQPPMTGFMAKKQNSNLRLDVSKEDVGVSSPKLSPISPRPWYKRPVSGSREPSSIPFKREVILRTVDKRRRKKAGDEDQQPEIGFMRSSRFGLFSRNKEAKKQETTEEIKRRSGIGMPNISELDREAQQIVRNQRITLTDEVVLRQRDLISDSEEEIDGEGGGDGIRHSHFMPRGAQERPPRKSAKELISQFEDKKMKNSQNLTTTLNATIDVPPVENGPTQVINPSTPPTMREIDGAAAAAFSSKNTVIQPDVVKSAGDEISGGSISGNSNKIQAMWRCPYCTLENPNWRILCEVCERIKPYETKSGAGLIPIGIVAGNNKVEPPAKLTIDNNKDLEKKVGQVRKYFTPNIPNTNTPLTKSASETSVGGNLMTSPNFKKSSIDSPNLNEIRRLVANAEQEYRHIHSANEVVVNSVMVLQDPGPSCSSAKKMNSNGTPDLEEVRHARLNHFKPQLQSRDSTAPVMITDKDSLDRERERLKQKIRAMNAKVIEKQQEETYDTVYPKNGDGNPSPRRLSPDRSAGAIKKCFNKQPVNNPESTRNDPKEDVVGPAQCVENVGKSSDRQLRDLAAQLQSQEGRDEFKATLKYTEKTGTIAINKLIKSLELAIMDGNDEVAAKLAKDLAKMKVSLSVTRQKREDSGIKTGDPNEIG